MINPNASPLVFSKEIDVRLTLLKLHTEFPNLSLDELFKILDCITLYTSVITEEPTPRVVY